MTTNVDLNLTTLAEPASPDAPAALYPIALKLAGARCLVVGGGVIALRKTADLLACGADLHVVALEWRAEFAMLEAQGRLTRSTRPFEPSDLDGASLVISATDDPQVQRLVAAEAQRRGIPYNVVDVNDLCSFYVPAVLRRGSLTVAISTDGKFPLLAVALRERLAEVWSTRIAEALDRLAEGRALAFATYPSAPGERVGALRRLLDARAINAIVAGHLEEFDAHYAAWKATLAVAS